MEKSYSEDVILNSELENKALERHLKWGVEDDFWKYEYNYSSSVASAIHIKVREACGIAGAGKKTDEQTAEERLMLEQLEHRRWNAYMRSEGFTYAQKRNNLAKTHHCLVEFKKLSQKEQEKDDD